MSKYNKNTENHRGDGVLMKIKQFKKFLEDNGILVSNLTNHWKLLNPKNGKWTTLPRHPSQEISNIFAKKILKQLGI